MQWQLTVDQAVSKIVQLPEETIHGIPCRHRNGFRIGGNDDIFRIFAGIQDAGILETRRKSRLERVSRMERVSA